MRNTVLFLVIVVGLSVGCGRREAATLPPISPLPYATLVLPAETRCMEAPPRPVHICGPTVLLQIPIFGESPLARYRARLADEGGAKPKLLWAGEADLQEDHTLLLLMPSSAITDRKMRLTVLDSKGAKESSFTFIRGRGGAGADDRCSGATLAPS